MFKNCAYCCVDVMSVLLRKQKNYEPLPFSRLSSLCIGEYVCRVNNVHGWKRLQCYLFNVGKTAVIYFTLKIMCTNFNCYLCSIFIIHPQRVNVSGVILDFKLIECHVASSLKMLGLRPCVTSSVSTVCSLRFAYRPVRPKLEFMHLSPGTPLHRQIRPYWKEFKEFFFFCLVLWEAVSVGTCCKNYEDVFG